MRDKFVAIARSYLKTPYIHQGRLPGTGLDCAGLVVCAARAVGIQVKDVTGYSRTPDGTTFLAGLNAQMTRISNDQIQPGDVLAFAFNDAPQHCAIVTETTPEIRIIHAHMRVRSTVEHGLDDYWLSKIRCAFSFKEFE